MNAMLPLTELTPHKLTVEELLAFVESRAFEGSPRMELLDGTLYEMSPQKSPHVLAKNRLTFRLQSKVLELSLPFEALCEPTITVGPSSAPEPDVILCSSPEIAGFYPASSVLLAIEVSLSTLQTDLHFKKALYAAAAIPEYWVVDLASRQVHQFWSPIGEEYRDTRTVVIGERLTSATITDVSVESAGLI